MSTVSTYNKLSSMFSAATTQFNNLMEPVRDMAAYVKTKNEYDAQLADGSLAQEDYDEMVSTLQEDHFGDNETKLAVANKLEAVADWADEHGITEKIQDTTDKVQDAVSSKFDREAETEALTANIETEDEDEASISAEAEIG